MSIRIRHYFRTATPAELRGARSQLIVCAGVLLLFGITVIFLGFPEGDAWWMPSQPLDMLRVLSLAASMLSGALVWEAVSVLVCKQVISCGEEYEKGYKVQFQDIVGAKWPVVRSFDLAGIVFLAALLLLVGLFLRLFVIGIVVVVIAVGAVLCMRLKRRKLCPKCGFDLRRVSGTTLSTAGLLIRNGLLCLVTCPMCGTTLKRSFRIPFHDFRSEAEKQIEHEAQANLGGENEEIARRLLALLENRDTQGVREEARSEIRRIGENLASTGGDRRMRLIAHRVAALGGSARYLEHFWHGICGWQA